MSITPIVEPAPFPDDIVEIHWSSILVESVWIESTILSLTPVLSLVPRPVEAP